MPNGEDTDSSEPSTTAGGADEGGLEIVVKFDPARIQRWRETGSAPRELIIAGDAVAAEGLTLEAAHPGATTTDLQAWYRTVAPDPDVADHLVEMLLSSPAVISAFVKPPAERPG